MRAPSGREQVAELEQQVSVFRAQAAEREEAVRSECESLRAQLVVAQAKEMEERAAKELAQQEAQDAGEVCPSM
jgi:hypothetical protein